MVSIVRPGELGSQSNARISTGIAAQAGAGQVALGQTIAGIGRQSQQSNQISLAKQMSALIDREANVLFAESRKAHQAALLMNKTNEATQQFNEAKRARYSQVTDDKGNPTFETLHKDIEASGQKILEGTLKGITDREVANQFKARFGDYVNNQKISAVKEAARQQVSYAKESLNVGLDTLSSQALNDDLDQLGDYESQGIQSLQESVQSGVITEEEFTARSKQFSSDLRENALRQAINSDRQRAAQALELPAEELGIEESTKENLLKSLDSAVKSDIIAAKKAEEIERIDNLTTEAAIVESLESRIEADNLREDELLSVEGKISDSKFNTLKKKHIREQEKRNKERREFQDIASRIANGQDITNVKPAKIDDLYDYMVAQAVDTTGQAISLAQEAQIASAIPAPIRRFAAKAEHAAKFGDTANAADTLAAYTYVKDRKRPTLESGFDKEATLIMEHTELLVERAGVDAPEALVSARDKILNKDEPTRKLRESLFRKESDFKDINIEETAASELDAESFFGTNRISADAVNTFRELAREGFVNSGDKETAFAYAKELMGRTHGHSNVTAKEQYMFSPPEKAFPSLTGEQLRDILVTEVTPMLPAGIDPKSVSIASDDITSGQVQMVGLEDGERSVRSVQSWTVTYMREVNGEQIEVPLINERTGQPLRWSPIGTTVLEQRQQEKITAAEQAREEFVSTQTTAETQLQEAQQRLGESVPITRRATGQESPSIEKQVTVDMHMNLKDAFLEEWNPEQDEQGLTSKERDIMDKLVSDEILTTKDIETLKEIRNKDKDVRNVEELDRVIKALEDQDL